MVKTIGQLYLEARKALLTKEDEDTAAFYARALIESVTGKSREQLILLREMYLGEKEVMAVEDGVLRLLHDEPLAYVIGRWDFYGMTLTVNRSVLIPRDDTCAVTDLAIEACKKMYGELRVLDLCTGSGCIGLAIAKHVPNVRVTLADISKEALSVARKNAADLKLSALVGCVSVDALNAPPAFLGKFDLIVSNPPYITCDEMRKLPRSVGVYEPHLALNGGEDGLVFYRKIAENYKNALKNGGRICFEFGMGQGEAVGEILKQNGYADIAYRNDFNDRQRAVCAHCEREDD